MDLRYEVRNVKRAFVDERARRVAINSIILKLLSRYTRVTRSRCSPKTFIRKFILVIFIFKYGRDEQYAAGRCAIIWKRLTKLLHLEKLSLRWWFVSFINSSRYFFTSFSLLLIYLFGLLVCILPDTVNLTDSESSSNLVYKYSI